VILRHSKDANRQSYGWMIINRSRLDVEPCIAIFKTLYSFCCVDRAPSRMLRAGLYEKLFRNLGPSMTNQHSAAALACLPLSAAVLIIVMWLVLVSGLLR
jgi:hypothetical protein